MTASPTAYEIQNLTKSFGGRKALHNINLSVRSGEMVALLGASGSGKSTLLRLMAGLAKSDPAGAICLFDAPIQTAGKLSRSIRQQRRHVGFVFQQFNLVGRLPLIINVLAGVLGRIPLYRSLFGIFTAAERGLARVALARVALDGRDWQRADSLSGGQQQRAAIARILVQQAKIILADEPVASLDPDSAHRVMALLRELHQKEQMTVIVSLHQVELARRYCDRIVALSHGKIIYDGPADTLSVKDIENFYRLEQTEMEQAA